MRQLILFALLLGGLYAKSYHTIEYEGLLRLSDMSATELVGFGPGDTVSQERINAALLRLFDQGYFADIVVSEPSEGVLRFSFTEKPAITRLELEGVSDNERDEKYMPALGIRRGEIYDARRVERAQERLMEIARAEGFYDTVVEVELEPAGEGVALTFHFHKGERITITQTRFHGLEAFDRKELHGQMGNRQAQSFSWFPGRNNGRLRLLELPHESARIQEYYLQHGYLDVEVADPFLMADFSSYTATLDFQIEEGKPYAVSEVAITTTDRPDEDLDALLADLRLQPMRIFNVDHMRRDMDRIREHVADQGYAFVRVEPDIRPDPDRQLAALTFRVTYGQKVHIRDVVIGGNSRTLDRVVRREVFLAPGDLYSLSELRQSRNALNRLGYFERVEIEERRVSESEMDLIITTKETPTGNLMIGGGYSSYDGFIFNASVTDRNVFGSGISLGFELDTSSRTRRTELSLTNPRVRDSVYSLGFSIFQTRYRSDDYTRESEGLSTTVGRRFDRHWRGSLTGSWSRNDNSYRDADVHPLLIDGETTKISLTPTVRFNNTDDFFVPREGMTFSQSLEYTGFSGDESYTKSTTSLALFKGLEPLIEYDLILRYRARLQLADADADDVRSYPLGSRLYLGGSRSLRGYRSGSVAPVLKDDDGEMVTDQYGDARYMGGTYAFNQSIEASLPLIPDANMRMALFYDYGAIGLDDFDVQRSSYGVALEWFSPMGPLQFIWAWPIDKEPHDRTSTFEFTLGQRF